MSLQPQEWSMVFRAVLGTFIPAYLEKANLKRGKYNTDIIQFIAFRTLSYGKFIERISFDHFMNGNIAFGSIGIRISKEHFWRTRKELIDHGIILTYGSKQQTYYILNLPKMMRLCLSVWLHARANGFDDCISDYVSLCQKLDGIWAEEGYEDKSLKIGVIMEDLKQIQIKVRKMLNEKRKARVEKNRKKQITVPKLKEHIISKCIEENLEYTTWPNAKLRGKAKNFINYMAERGEDARDVIDDVIEKWRRIVPVARNKFERPIALKPNVFNFELFFDNRDYILPLRKELKSCQDRGMYGLRKGARIIQIDSLTGKKTTTIVE